MQTTATPIDSDDSAIDNITVIPLDLFDDSDIAAAMGYMSWLGNPTSQETSDDSSRFQMPHQSIDGTGISCCSTKPKKHRRKQDMIVRQHDDIEFVGSTVCAEEKSQPSPLGDISNTIVHQPASSSSAANTPASIDLIKERRISIKRKLENSALSEYILFTEEECDILRKANVFLSKVKPDPKYCFAPGTTQELSTPNDAPIVDKLEGFEFSNDISPSLRTVNPQPVYVVHAHSYPLLRDHKPGTELPIGTQLLKPEEKLVELVARAIDESPDELLQVQQVYTDIIVL
ncbi:uncharacterized protein [Watersipora subatra]|uniref:uncharacterized protein isoform X2 n=1 Tax=Watersipora subatra TaxID=2589382 RepID=UPI00355C12A5